MLVHHSEMEETSVYCPRTARAKKKRLIPTTAGPRRLPSRNDLGELPQMRQETVRLCPARTSRARPPVPVEHHPWWTEPGAESAPGPGIGEGRSGGGKSPGLSPAVPRIGRGE